LHGSRAAAGEASGAVSPHGARSFKLSGRPAARSRSRIWRSRADFQLGRLEPVRIAAGEDDLGALSLGAPGRLEPDAGAAADHDDRLAGTPVRAEWTWPTVT